MTCVKLLLFRSTPPDAARARRPPAGLGPRGRGPPPRPAAAPCSPAPPRRRPARTGPHVSGTGGNRRGPADPEGRTEPPEKCVWVALQRESKRTPGREMPISESGRTRGSNPKPLEDSLPQSRLGQGCRKSLFKVGCAHDFLTFTSGGSLVSERPRSKFHESRRLWECRQKSTSNGLLSQV